jgi:hypothetical protein
MPVNLNNKAVELIAVGHYEEAMSTLINALQLSNKIMSEAEETNLPFRR